MYTEDDMLMLSGIQHFAFCPRQWALIDIDQQWDDNRLTIEGEILHKHVDDPFYRQKMGDVICLRTVSIASKELGLYGYSDIVELYPSDSSENAITHPNYPGYWLPYPVEYKHGKPKPDYTEAVQLCAQAICLEEQYEIHIPEGAIYYGEIRQREVVTFDDDIRSNVHALAEKMHAMYDSQKVPYMPQRPCCRSCSIKDICMPEASAAQTVSNYLKNNLYAETT